jgi:hypothetical protein
MGEPDEKQSGQALVHSKMEVMQNRHEIREAIENSIQLSKRTVKNELQTYSKLSEAEEEHESKDTENLQSIAQIWGAAIGRISKLRVFFER